ncbi:transglycosylase domain-containing protein [Ruminococcaceae bacterium OttesenSCG-928-I18]|nr:transglycosylase domain-containing protein [Ruminococcaceae bacterium OttesenSCG-928-I18]
MDKKNGQNGPEKERQVYRAGERGGHGQPGGRIRRRTGGEADPAPSKAPKAKPPLSPEERFDPTAKTGPESWLNDAKPVQKSLFSEKPKAGTPAQGNLFEDFDAQQGEESLFEGYGQDPGRQNRQPSVWELGLGEEEPPEEEPSRAKKQRKKKKQRKAKKEKPQRLRKFLRERRARWSRKDRVRWRELSWKQRGLKVLKWGAICLSVLLLITSVSLGIFWTNSTRNDDLWLDLNQIPYKTETILYYTDQQTGETGVYATLPCTQNKEYVDGALMPQALRDAFVAVEDQKFYKHGGVDIKRTIFAALNEVKYRLTGSYIGGDGGRRQGASTINQQLVKNLTRDDEDSNMAGYLRKLREIYRAWKLDSDYSKEEILSAYLNTISFTGNTAGVQAEAQKLFGKPVEELNLAECASLAAITRNPSRYNPVTNPENHVERRNYVLSEMLDQGYIDEGQYNEAVAAPLEVTGEGDPVREQEVTSYFTDAVMDEVVDQLVNERGLSRKEANNLLYNGGLRIYTTVVPELQEAMEEEMESARSYPRPHHTVQGPLTDEDGNPVLDEDGEPVIGDVEEYAQAAMVSLDYEGGVCAVVGGLGEKEISRGFNRGISAIRQVGSTMKGIAPYPLAIEDNEITWSTAFPDKPVRRMENEETGEMEDWPANVDRIYSERDILVREAFARSVNTIAVRVGEEVGNFRMYRFVKNELEIPTFIFRDNKPGPLVLGSSTYGIAPVEMAKAYAMNGNGGYVPTVHTYTQITNGTGEVLLQRDAPLKQVIGEDTAYIMNRLMREVMVGDGTAAGMSVPGEMDSVGKTGTTSDNRDHWFIGLTPYYVTASWYGYDDNTPLEVNYRSHPPTAAWRNVMAEAQEGLAYREFPQSSTVVTENYCTESGYAAGANCPSREGYYKPENLPRSGCPIHS